MAAALKKLFGTEALPPEIKGELRTTLLQMRQERNALEALATQVQETAAAADKLAAPVAEARESLAALQAKVGVIEQAVSNVSGVEARLADLESRLEHVANTAEGLSSEQKRTEAGFQGTAGAVRAAKEHLETVQQGLGDVAALRDAVGQFAGMREEIAAVREDLDALQSQASALDAEREKLRSQHDAMVADNRAVRSQLQESVGRCSTLQGDVAEAAQRVSSLREAIDPVADLVRGVPEARRELQKLQALREFVAQKTAGLQEQRDLVERVTERGERLELMIQRLDREIEQQGSSLLTMSELRESVEEHEAEHQVLCESLERINAAHQEIRARDEAMRRELEALQRQLAEDLERATTRFAFEREGLDAVSERVGNLRNALTQAEQRFEALEDASAIVDEVRGDAGELRKLVVEMERDVTSLALQAERTRELEPKLRQIEGNTAELAAKLAAIREPSDSAIAQAEMRVSQVADEIEELERRVEQVSGTADAIRSLGREVERRRLAVEESLAQLRHAAEMRQAATTAADRLNEQTEELAASVRGAEDRLSLIRESVSKLDERAEQLTAAGTRMDRFEDRLRQWQSMEARLERATAQAAQREEVVHALREDLQRMFALVEETADRVREVIGARGELEIGRGMLDDLIPRLRDLNAEAERLDEKQGALEGQDALFARIEAMLSEVRTSHKMLEDQKEFLDQVLTTAGTLRYQCRQAESLVESLEEMWNRARG